VLDEIKKKQNFLKNKIEFQDVLDEIKKKQNFFKNEIEF
jgi:hypothetical protein